MNRRSAIRTIVISSAGVVLLPACTSEEGPAVAGLTKIKINSKQARTLASLTEFIIPTTSTPGAKEEKSDAFILKMVNDCASPDDQQKFINGLKAFEKLATDKFGKSFDSLDTEQKTELLTSLETKKGETGPAAEFYSSIKGMTIQNYTGGDYFMTNVMEYNIIPKRYKGCVPVKTA